MTIGVSTMMQASVSGETKPFSSRNNFTCVPILSGAAQARLCVRARCTLTQTRFDGEAEGAQRVSYTRGFRLHHQTKLRKGL